MPDPDDAILREAVRARYASAATQLGAGSGCCATSVPAPACCDDAGDSSAFGAPLYGAEVEGLPDEVVAASLGCGNPTAVSDLRPGEVVLDLGSGAGLDALVSARRVGPTGRVIGLDMTAEMRRLAERHAARAGATSVDFVAGTIEAIPLPDASVDVIVSNCVVNLSPDKAAVLRESFRVLRPGGRLAVTDVVAEDRLTPADRARRGSTVGCVAGALSVSEFELELRAAGFLDISLTFTHPVADGLHGTIVRAAKPAAATAAPDPEA
ncbi:MAG TPA: arsenite methyltransferase [Candidatus Micrarchaeia archaeon]|nr:arsenite methyltransferase [Candidatus Micrarchaeia archaeon]